MLPDNFDIDNGCKFAMMRVLSENSRNRAAQDAPPGVTGFRWWGARVVKGDGL